MSANADVAEDLLDRVAQLHRRLHLGNVRVQRLHAQTFADPPIAPASIVLTLATPEVLIEEARFSTRLTQQVAIKGEDQDALAEVEIALVVDFDLDEGPEPDAEAVAAYVDRNVYFIAHPYLREAVQDATMRLGLDPVVIGVLDRGEDRPAEVTIVPRR